MCSNPQVAKWNATCPYSTFKMVKASSLRGTYPVFQPVSQLRQFRRLERLKETVQSAARKSALRLMPVASMAQSRGWPQSKRPIERVKGTVSPAKTRP